MRKTARCRTRGRWRKESTPHECHRQQFRLSPTATRRTGPDRELTYIAAISEALREEMRRDPNVLLMGEDIAGDFGGAFKVTKGFEAEFGARRVMNTPLAELAFVGAATGMALMGLRPVIEMQFADFITTAFDSIVQFAATTHYRWGGAVPWVIRAPADGGIRSGPFHSQNPEAWFVHTPGLKVVAPGHARRRQRSAHRRHPRQQPGDLSGEQAALPFPEGLRAAWRLHGAHRQGPSGPGRGRRLDDHLRGDAAGSPDAAERLAADGIAADVLDLRSLKPLDKEAILTTARRTGKVLIVHAANRLGGIGGEIAGLIAEEAFEWLDAPVRRLGGLDTPVPFSPPLEDAYRPNAEKIYNVAKELVAF